MPTPTPDTAEAPPPPLSEAAWAKFETVEDAQASFRAYFDKAYPGTSYAEAHDTNIGTSKSECRWETREAVQDSATGRWSGFVAGKFVATTTDQGITVQSKEELTIFFQPDPAKKAGWICDGTKSVAKRDPITRPSGEEIHPPSQNGCFRIMVNCHGRNPTKAEMDEALSPANTKKP